MAKHDFTMVCERIAKLEEAHNNQSKKMDTMYKAMMGNGQPGFVAEWNQWKGGAKLFGWCMGIAVGILGVAVSLLACFM